MSGQILRKRCRCRFKRDERGQAQIETAVTIFTILFIIFAAIEIWSAVYTYVVLSDAANEGLRHAIVSSSDGGDTNTKAIVQRYAAYSLHDVSAMTVTVSTTAWAPPNTVTVTVNYPYVPWLGAFMSAPPTMNAYAQGRFVN